MSDSLASLLRRRIEVTGPLTIAEFMAEALGNPEHGYYMTRDPLGVAGDFTTAPEISQMFGELIGLWCAEMWRELGEPKPVRLVELGPGRGTLMADALRAARMAPGFVEALSVELVETSPVLRRRQREILAGYDVAWRDSLADVPDGPALVVANEFFDALPVHQFQLTASGWRERMVGLDGGAFRLALAPGEPAAALLIPEPVRATARQGDVAETRPAAIAIARILGERIAGPGGAALVIDYGHGASAAGDTLQAVRGHKNHDWLAEPGAADLTAHVDFEALAGAAKQVGAAAWGPTPQGDFLGRLGLEARAERLLRDAAPAQARDIEAARRRLTDPAEMGALFKVVALVRPGLSAPPGFQEMPEGVAAS